MICLKQTLRYLVCALTLISAPLWGKTELPVLPATIAVQGLSLHIDPKQSVYDANTGFSGVGTMFFPALGRELPVTYANVRLDAQAQWQSGNVKARIAPDLLKAAAIDNIASPKFVGNFDGLKSFIRAARSHIDELPLMLTTLPSYEKADFGTLSVMLTEINVSKEGTTASMMALERMPEGIYLPFTRTGVVFDPLSMQPFKEMQLDLTATADVTDIQMPISFKAGDATGSTGTYVTFDCNGLKVFHVEGFHKFTSGVITPSPASAPAVVATFSADVKSLRQFVIKVTMPKFTIAGFDDVAFEIKDATIDYSDSENSTTFPRAYFSEMGNTAPTKKETWKGIHIGNIAISLPTLPMKDRDGNPFTFAARDMIYDKGNGFSATFFIKTKNIANVNVKGFSLKLDEFNLRLKKNSVQDLNFLGSVGIPVLKDEKGALEYKATFNTSGDASKASFQLSVLFPNDITLEVPFLQLAKCTLQKSSVLTMQMRNGSPLVFANLHGSFNIGTQSPKLSMGLPFEGWKIGDDPSVTTTSGADELPMSFKAFDTNGGSNAAPEKKMSGFPLSIDNIGFKTVKGVYELRMDIGVTLGKGKSSFGAKGGVVISAGLEFSKLVSLQPWEGIKFKGVALDALAVDADMSTFRFTGALTFLKDDPIYGNGFEAALSLNVKAGNGFAVDAKGLFGNKDDYSYFFVDANVTLGKGVALVSPLNLYTIGGGVYFNMKQTLSADGKTNKYVPQKNVLGFMARVGIGLQKKETFHAVGELQFEFGADWELRFFKIQVKAGVLNDFNGFNPSANTPYNKSKIAGGCTMMYDNMNKTITVNMYVELQNMPVTGRAELNMFFDINDKANWYVRFGTPQSPAYVTWGPAKVGMYVMLGKGGGDLPDMGKAVPDLIGLDLVKAKREDFNKKGSLNATGSGFAFGISYKMEQNFSFLMFSGGVKAAFGVDAILQDDLECNGTKLGWNGWYMSGQAYAYIGARVDLDVNLLFIKGKFNLVTVKVGAVLQAQLPSPMLLSGRAAARYSILGGMVSGKFNVEFELKDGNACKVQTFPKSPAVGQPVVSATYPDVKEEIQIFDDIIVSTNLAVRDVQTYEFTDQNGNESRHFYKVRLTEVDVMEGTKKLATLSNSAIQYKDDYTLVLTPNTALPAKTKLKLVITAKAYDTDIDGRELKTIGTETRTVEFKTAARPEKVYAPMISYSAPGTDQKYWYKGYAKPKVTLKQNGYEYLFEPNYNNIPSEYKWILYKKQGTDSTIVGTYDLNGTLNGKEAVSVTAQNGAKCGYTSRQVRIWSYQYQTVVTANTCTYTDSVQSRSFSFNKLNELDLDKKATYRIEVIRRPKQIQQKAIATTNVSTTNAVAASDTANEASMTTRSLSVAKSNAQEIAIIYTNVFSISKLTNVADKIKVAENCQVESISSLGQQNVSATNNLDGDIGTKGSRPYLTVVGTTEPLDKYDSERILANSSFTQSSGFEFFNKINSTNSRIKGSYGTEKNLMANSAHYYSSGRDVWYNGMVMNASLKNFIRSGSSGAELVMNSVNVQWVMSELMQKSGQSIRTNSPNCRTECTSRWGWGGWCGCIYWNRTTCKEVCYTDQSPFVVDWSKKSYCYMSGWSQRCGETPNPNRYNPGNYRINGTFSYTTPSTIPECFTQPVKGTSKTYNFGFTPPAR